MINTELLRLIKEYDLYEEDAIEVARIFEVMTDDKKIEILRDWSQIVKRIKANREQMEQERMILLVNTIKNIESDLEEYNRQITFEDTKKSLKQLKQK
jgi:hypothetical protein